MAYYKVFCFFCSVRLGSIVVGILSFVKSIEKSTDFEIKKRKKIIVPCFQAQQAIPALYITIMGPTYFSSTSKYLEEYVKDKQLDDSFLPEFKSIDKRKRNPETDHSNRLI